MILQLLLPFAVFNCINACTETILRGDDGSITLGRTMDFDVEVDYSFFIEPKGTKSEAVFKPLPESCKGRELKWTSRYKGIFVRPVDLELRSGVVDGINEAGLTGAVLYFHGFSKYESISVDNCASSISQYQVVGYILAMYGSVAEVREAYKNGTFPTVVSFFLLGDYHGAHYSVTDKTGAAIVIEYSKTGLKIHDNIAGVMTNSPGYEWHMTNLNHYVHLQNKPHPERKYKDPMLNDHLVPELAESGLLGMPGDNTSPSRFIRAAHLVRYVERPKNSEEAIIASFHIMESVNVIIGTEEGQVVPGRTFWTLVKDLKNLCIYYRHYNYLSIRKVCMADVPNEHLMLPIDKGFKSFEDGVENMSKKMKSAKTESQL